MKIGNFTLTDWKLDPGSVVDSARWIRHSDDKLYIILTKHEYILGGAAWSLSLSNEIHDLYEKLNYPTYFEVSTKINVEDVKKQVDEYLNKISKLLVFI